MKKLSLLKVWKWVIILFQASFLLLGIFFIYSSFDISDIYIDGLSFLPENSEIKSEDVSIAFKADPAVTTRVFISETQIHLENGFSYIRTSFIIVVILCFGLSIFGLEQLKKMINTVEAGDPFIRTNVWRIYILATLFFLTPLVIKLCFYFMHNWALTNFEFSGLVLRKQAVNYVPWMVAGVLLLTIGKIMEQGIKLREEQELTI